VGTSSQLESKKITSKRFGSKGKKKRFIERRTGHKEVPGKKMAESLGSGTGAVDGKGEGS